MFIFCLLLVLKYIPNCIIFHQVEVHVKQPDESVVFWTHHALNTHYAMKGGWATRR